MKPKKRWPNNFNLITGEYEAPPERPDPLRAKIEELEAEVATIKNDAKAIKAEQVAIKAEQAALKNPKK